jgi:hypothetical protein
MDPRLRKIFALLPHYEIGIVGSAIRDVDTAHDIDILFLEPVQFASACKEYGVKWQGWDADLGHVCRGTTQLPGFDKPVQFVLLGSVRRFEDNLHCVLKRDGTFVKEGVFMVKGPGWRYEKGITVDRRKESKMVVAMDFDGTVRDWDTNQPLPGARDAINLLREHKIKVVIHTCNNPLWVKSWCENNDIRYDDIWDKPGKPVAALYVDDRGFRYTGNWTEDIKIILGLLNAEALHG